MKIIRFYFVFLLLLLTIGCKKLNIERELRIDIGTVFQDDFVSIKLDDTIVFSDSVSTNHMLGYGKILEFKHPIGKYEIHVNVNGIEKSEKFRHKKDRFIYISFDEETSKINIDFPDEKYNYD